MSKNPDLLKVFGYDDVSLLAHFVNNGMREGRQGNAAFSVQSYKNANGDLRKAFGNNLKSYYLHYIDYGKKEGRPATGYETRIMNPITVYRGIDYAAVYDANDYLKYNPDLLSVFGYDEEKLLEHFVNCGMQEGRQASKTFSVQIYRQRYSDLRSVLGNNLKEYYLHYVNYGKKEGRKGW